MSTPIDIIARALSADLQRLDAVAQNVANSATPGYRAQRNEPAFATLVGAAQRTAAGPELRLAVQDGPLRSTGRPLDVGLSGDAWLTVQGADGPRYTRNGSLSLDAKGQLVDAIGRPVLGESGPLTLPNSAVRITADGRIFDGTTELDRLRLAALPDTAKLAPDVDGAVAYSGTPLEATRYAVNQGFLETSNVQVADEMTRLIEIQRHVESVQRAITSYDHILDAGINEIGSR
jgi:flagellar basal body rod protein FlgG